MKICTKCGVEKGDEEFSFKNKALNKRSAECKVCHREGYKNYYNTNRIDEKRRLAKRKKEISEWYTEYKQILSCSRCSENHPATLHFHHTDPTTKNFEVSQMSSSGYSRDRILEEMSKCIILCANCHAKEHYIVP